MKKYLLTPLLVLLFVAGTTSRAPGQEQESLGLPGDNLNLYAVMELFQKSETLEAFERSLNDENSGINNLDLNGDGHVDYIRVIDNADGNVHNIVLQVAINVRENQDVAVFTVWRESDNRVQIQLTGDESLYGRNYIVEPIFDEGERGQTPNPGYTGNTQTINGQNVIVSRTTTFEIATWPLVRFIFMPSYVVWHSPWYYSYYPSYWHPWRPFSWDYYYGYQYHNYSYYHGHYRNWNDHRYPNWHNSYYSRRTYSPEVHTKIQGGYYKQTYSHPEQRREGTAMYYKAHPDQNYRTSDRSAGNTTVRRSSTQTGTSTRQPPNTGTTRRSTSASSNRTSTATGTNTRSPNTSTARPSTTTETNRKSTTTETYRRPATTESSRKPSTTETSRKPASTGTDTRSASPKSGGRSTTAAPDRSGSKSNVHTETNRSGNGGQSGNTGSGKSTRGSNKNGHSENKDKSSGRSGESGNRR